MKIVLTTYGSRGDVQPMLALSLALKASGHNVLLVGPPEKKDWAREVNCPYHPLGSDVTDYIDRMDDAHSLASAARFVRLVRREIVYQFRAFPDIIAKADLVIGASLVFGLSTVAESLGIPYRYVCFTPQLLPSGHHPFMAFKHHRLPEWYNRMTWRIVKTIDRFNLTRLINRQRTKLSLAPVENIWLHILGNNGIVASDPIICGVPHDVEPHFTQTGYLHLPQPDCRLEPLERFLEKGPPPVYAGFGSMPVKDQARNVPLIVATARSVGRRVVISKFWEDPTAFDQSEDVFFIRHYPHLQLFPRMAAVIHHGGAGTTASGVISGVPQIIVPHILDQYYWGDRIFRTRLGPEPVWRSRLTQSRLVAAIQTCLSDGRIRKNVRTAALAVQQQNSLEQAVGALLA